MAMAIAAKREGEPASEINTTPLIDVMLVLLVMLIVSLPPRLDAVSMDLPQPTKAPPPPAKPITITIDGNGGMTWNGARLSLAEMDRRLGEVDASQPQVTLMPERLVRYGRVVAVMAAVQRHDIVSMSVIPAS